MGMQVPHSVCAEIHTHSVCAEIQKADNVQANKGRCGKDTKGIVRKERDRDNRGRMLS